MPKVIVTIDREDGSTPATADFEVTAEALAQVGVWRQQAHMKKNAEGDYRYASDIDALLGNLLESFAMILRECPTEAMLAAQRGVKAETDREVKRVLART
jgi:hypothetical protein